MALRSANANAAHGLSHAMFEQGDMAAKERMVEAVFDELMLDNARSLGATVVEGTLGNWVARARVERGDDG